MLRGIILLTASVTLAGCGPSREEVFQAAQNDCAAYGAAYGSPQYTQCMMMKDQQFQDQQMQRRAHVQQSLRNMQVQQPVQMAPRTCTSNTFGNQTTTNCQ